ncbi:ATP-binding SpoIIE family protein phosphatase [Streptomyces zingiberis]|uniref:SpoIIE family protein phosphatase n=1 Tax=Streptomyces zingiberis TaxID=2053010 RepID=A0ABX1BY46_9ACTN|nr:ATP-binding SpoIIE family protein phosphatase [Streptomyces zingiberis]NJQ00234.1 SpoIIE family protein phosphatase [Streptomyces zingiberis]
MGDRDTAPRAGPPEEAAHAPGTLAARLEEATTGLAQALDVRDVVRVVEGVHGADRVGPVTMLVGLVEKDRLHIIARGTDGTARALVTEYAALDSDDPLCEAVRTGKVRLIGTRAEFTGRHPRLARRLAAVPFGSAAFLPLVAQSRTLGALGVLFPGEFPGEEPFGAEGRSLYVGFASSLAQSLQRAILYDQAHDIAEELQETMLPRVEPFPGVEAAVRYRPARLRSELGGDWYDLVPLPDGRVGAFIGDVTGHDTKAAAVMGQLRIALRAYAAEGHAPTTVMARASVFLEELDTDRFATCLYAEIQPATGEVRLVRAGHLNPLLRQADGACRPLPVAGGLPLGLSAEFGGLEYPVTPVELAPDETLVLHTDGLVERPGTDLEEGCLELVEAVRTGPFPLEDLAEHLTAAMHPRTGDDDMALLLLRRTAPTRPRAPQRLHQHIAPSDPDSLATARGMLREAVRAWGIEERADDIELAADELITNSLIHTDGGAVITAVVRPGRARLLHLEVRDRSSSWPRRREPGDAGTSGRGLMLVELLSDDWGVESRGQGKSVWCEFRLPATATATGTATADPDADPDGGAAGPRAAADP